MPIEEYSHRSGHLKLHCSQQLIGKLIIQFYLGSMNLLINRWHRENLKVEKVVRVTVEK